MPTQGCLDNIKSKNPPIYCGDLCGQIQGDINEYCHHNGLGGDVPVPQIGTNGKCWCCCSCMAWGTPIEVSKETYKLIEKIMPGENVLATGGNLNGWEECEVTEVGGIAPGTPLDFCYTADITLADGTHRQLVSTADHLYLVPGGTLKPVQDLRPGNKVVQADGKEATINHVGIGQWSGGVRNFAMGEFDPKKYPNDPYKGHLMNTFGIVTADLAVQLAYYELEFAPTLVAEAGHRPAPIGSARFFKEHDTRSYEAFMSNPAQWPQGFKAVAPPLINIPPSAWAYFTPEQANDIGGHEPDQNIGNSEALAHFKYLKSIFRGFYPDLYYVANWTADEPNAWTFNEGDQTYIVLSGGLLRLSTMNIAGLSVVLGHMLAQTEGRRCTGDADYWGTALYLREIWFDDLYFEVFQTGLAAIKATFALVKPEHAKENPNNICGQPSLDCRIQAITNAGSFLGVPDCAKPPPDFAVTGASATSLEEVQVTFSGKVLVDSAIDPANYAILGIKPVIAARVDKDEKSVVLDVAKLQRGKSYKVVVLNVLSASGKELAPGHNQADFKTS
jgi:hypothetical protein